jgi:trimeric autotransporter adhesin
MQHALKTSLAALALALAAVPASAQSDILLQLRSGSPAGDRFRVDSAGAVVALGEIGIGIIPASGAGWRMMWHPQKVAFRAGYADAGNQFDESNIGYYSWAGGALSIGAGIYSFAMGNQNTVEFGTAGGMALGGSNKIWGVNFAQYGTALGWNNDVLDDYGVSAGFSNWSDGTGATAIGYDNTADADFSTALGYRASTNGHMGAMVLSDASTTDSTEASANNQFMSRFAGGYRLWTNAVMTNSCAIAAGGTSWVCSSSRALKENFTPVDGEELLARIRGVELNRWTLIGDPARTPHLGPFAEDFHAAFGLGDDPKAIGHQDIDGVNFGGVKALDARTVQMQSRMDEQARQIEQLQADKAALEARIQRLEALLAPAPAP